MYCEKCGKMNAEGAIFCSNCSSILRSRRQMTSQPAPDATKRFSVPEQPEKKEVPVAVKEQKKAAVEETRPVYRREKAPARPERPERRPAYVEETAVEDVKSSFAWYGILAAVSWLMFVAFASVGIIGGGLLLIYGFSGNGSILSFAGGAVLIICFVIGLAILSKNMIYIKTAKHLNSLKSKN